MARQLSDKSVPPIIPQLSHLVIAHNIARQARVVKDRWMLALFQLNCGPENCVLVKWRRVSYATVANWELYSLA